MKMKVSIAAVTAFLIVLFPRSAVAVDQTCNLPDDLQAEISRKRQASKIVSLSDLDEYDQGLFQKDHGSACPGLVNVDFYGDGKPTLAFVLIPKDGAKKNAELFLARQSGGSWRTTLLDTAKDTVPVLWKQDPGEYRDVYGTKKLVARKPGIVFCRYEAWAILYAWTNKHVAKIWLSD